MIRVIRVGLDALVLLVKLVQPDLPDGPAGRELRVSLVKRGPQVIRVTRVGLDELAPLAKLDLPASLVGLDAQDPLDSLG